MVTTPKAPPQRADASRILERLRNGTPMCVVCNGELPTSEAGRSDKEMRWCEPCHSFQKVYRGPARPGLCGSCYNFTGKDKKGRITCAFLLYQMGDGTWRDRYNQKSTVRYTETGMNKIETPVAPSMVTDRYECEGYEFIGEGQTRETLAVEDPLRFYHRSRFFS